LPKLRFDLVLPHDAPDDLGAIRKAAAEALRLPIEAIEELKVQKRALDARQRLRTPVWHLTVDASLARAPSSVHRALDLRPIPSPTARFASPTVRPRSAPVVVVGAGPAGLFASWQLAMSGARVVLVERGKPVETRARDFGRFRGRGVLDPESNLCFGEGGAGTYSDGKLTTRKNDPLVREVLERLVEVGAPPRILVDAKPHIGTNLLFRMLKGLRAELIRLGVEIRFETRLDRLVVDGGVRGVVLRHAGGSESIETDRVLLAIGHSARDTFEALLAQGVPIEAKPFAVGVRIEHPQELVDRAQYHQSGARPKTLPPADYRLTHSDSGRGVYSFCMCPGGMVVPTSTEPEMVVVNGMSTARRSSPFANSGLVVQVEIKDLEAEGCRGALAGVEFQRKLERSAYEAGGRSYRAPAMRARDFIDKRATGTLADSHFRPGLEPFDLDAVLPGFVAHGIRSSLGDFDRKIRGYASAEANLIAVETRTSSPIRIPRDLDRFEVPSMPGLHVAGEGPGYAGGIVSAAVDGLKAADAILRILAAESTPTAFV
jgi:uncharacterized FAD-dependent dehydrogenase